MMNNLVRALVLAACSVVIVACKNVDPDADQMAVIVNPTEASRAALQEAVNSELMTEVVLADDALTSTSVLIIERRIPRSIEGSPAQGRTMDMPIQFSLVKNSANCILIDQRDESRHVLVDTECVAK